MKFKVVRITNNLEDYPKCRKDTEEHPHLIKHVNDEMELFVIDETGNFYPADDFFYMVDVTEFSDGETNNVDCNL